MIINDILQPTHLLLILAVALLVLGPKRLPEAAKSIGRGLHDFRRAVSGEEPEPAKQAVAAEASAAPGAPADPAR